jgi:hypothetical protein
MPLFSERMGYKPVKESLKIECMDEELRISLWNLIFSYIDINDVHSEFSYCTDEMLTFIRLIYMDYWKRPLEDFYESSFFPFSELKRYFFNCSWFEVYDFIEIFFKEYPSLNVDAFIHDCNGILKHERAGYRFVGGKIVELTSETEIFEIEEALANSTKHVEIHLQKSLKLLSDKESPDYSNSIKESISAVESFCKVITGESLSLGQSLNKIESKRIIQLHPALKKGYTSIYGYTSDSDGIRHGLSDEPNLDFEDAIFMLVACSAFINYLKVKAEKSGLQ